MTTLQGNSNNHQANLHDIRQHKSQYPWAFGSDGQFLSYADAVKQADTMQKPATEFVNAYQDLLNSLRPDSWEKISYGYAGVTGVVVTRHG